MSAGPRFRWLGAAGIELGVEDQVLVIDPYFTRLSFWHQWFGRVHPNRALARAMIPTCTFILVTHAHWDHIMDVPEIAQASGAVVLGSSNTCQLLGILGVPLAQIREIQSGEELTCGTFGVTVFTAEHKKAPGFSPGRLSSNLHTPLRVRDYRMDSCFSFMISVKNRKLLTDPGERPTQVQHADVLMLSPHYEYAYLQALLRDVRPYVVIPIHWDDIWRPLTKPLRPMLKPPSWSFPPIQRISLLQFQQSVQQIDPTIRVFVPQIFTPYDLDDILGIA